MSALLIGIAGATLRSTGILVIAALVTWHWRRGPAARRHRVWTLACWAAIVMPVAMHVAPSWPILPDWWRLEVLHPVVLPVVRAGSEEPAPSTRSRRENSAAPIASTSASARAKPGLPDVLAVLWAAGALTTIAWLAIGMSHARRLRIGATVDRDRRVIAAAQAAQRALRLKSLPALLSSPALTTPLVVGWVRQTVLLPAGVAAWPVAELRAALLHEMAHVKRRDGIAQLASAAALVLYWFNPVVWIAARCMATERERACDEAVLATGHDALDYARELVAIAGRRARGIDAAWMLGMAHGALEGRIQGIFQWELDRHAVRDWHPIGVLLAAASVVLATASARTRAFDSARLEISSVTALGARAVRSPSDAHEGSGRSPERGAAHVVQARTARPLTLTRQAAGFVPADGPTRMWIPLRPGICGEGVPDEITYTRPRESASDAGACASSLGVLELTSRGGTVVDVHATVDSRGVSPSDRPTPEARALADELLANVAKLPSGVSARAVQTAAAIDGADVVPQLLALVRDDAADTDARRMSVVWADIVGGTNARPPLLALLDDESLDVPVREQILIALGSAAIPAAARLAVTSASERMREVAAHRIGLQLPVDSLLALYMTLPDARSRQDVADRVAERGTPAQRERFLTLVRADPDQGVRTSAIARLGAR